MDYIILNRYISKRALAIWGIEAILVFFAVLSATAVRYGFQISFISEYDPFLIKTAAMSLIYFIVFYNFSLYEPYMYCPKPQTYIKLLQATFTGSIILFILYFIDPSSTSWNGVLLLATAILPPVIILWRVAFSRWLNIKLPQQRVIVIGSEELAKKVGTEIFSHKELGFKLVGFIDDDPAKLGVSIVNPGVIGNTLEIPSLINTYDIDRIIVAAPDRRTKLPMSELLDCKLRGINVEEGETFLERMTGKVPLNQLKPSWLVFSDGFKILRTRKILKRIFDVIMSIVLMIILSPVMLIACILIKLDSRGPVIFKQTRVGENGKEYEIYKFRSMRQDAEAATGPVWAGAADSRITRVGNILRKLRIDEFPQLVNVIKGEMSFVGPRPERPFFVEQLRKEIPYYDTRLVVKPGITGWAQVRYPYGADVRDALEKLQYDLFYIKNMGLALDMIIVLLTIKVVLTGKGAR